jgi:hypothetical protein
MQDECHVSICFTQIVLYRGWFSITPALFAVKNCHNIVEEGAALFHFCGLSALDLILEVMMEQLE